MIPHKEEESFGKMMTKLLIPKRGAPRQLLSGAAFVAFVCFFLIYGATRSCVKEDTARPTATPASEIQPKE